VVDEGRGLGCEVAHAGQQIQARPQTHLLVAYALRCDGGAIQAGGEGILEWRLAEGEQARAASATPGPRNRLRQVERKAEIGVFGACDLLPDRLEDFWGYGAAQQYRAMQNGGGDHRSGD